MYVGLIAMEDGITNVQITVPDQTVVNWLGVQYNSGQTFTVTLDARYRTALVSSLLGDLTGEFLGIQTLYHSTFRHYRIIPKRFVSCRKM